LLFIVLLEESFSGKAAVVKKNPELSQIYKLETKRESGPKLLETRGFKVIQ